MAYGDNYTNPDRALAEYTLALEQGRAHRDQGLASEEAEKKKNWQQDAIRGAQMGSIAGPWGALAGLVLGAAKGTKDAVGQYRKEGHGQLKSIGKALFDFDRGFNTDTVKTGMQAAPAIASALKGKMRERMGAFEDSGVDRLALERAAMGDGGRAQIDTSAHRADLPTSVQSGYGQSYGAPAAPEGSSPNPLFDEIYRRPR